MSQTDDTQTQTIDIPLPDESDPSFGSNADSPTANEVTTACTPLTATAADVTVDQNVGNTSVHAMSSSVTDEMSRNSMNNMNNNCVMNPMNSILNANPFDASLQQSYQSYYSYYSSAYQQMPQMMPQLPQSYPYFMPLMRPMVPMVPQLSAMSAQNSSIATINAINNNNKFNTNNNNKRKAEVAVIEDSYDDYDDESSDSDPTVARKPSTKASNVLPIHCNEKMGLNPLLYTNVQQSPYFKNNLFQLKTYHEVIDEIFFSVKHLEPWEKGSRKVGGQTGMCGSVRGVGAGGIVSTPFCILFKLFTLKLTRKQVNGLIRHKDSPYIRALGFMYIRFTQPPQHLFNWLEPFLEDEEEVDPKAGGGQPMTIGQMCRHMLTKLDWFSTLFPRVPVPIQKDIESRLRKRDEDYEQQLREERGIEEGEVEDEEKEEPEERSSSSRGREVRNRSVERDGRYPRDSRGSHSRDRDRRSRSKEDKSSRSNDKHRHRQRSRSPHSHRSGRGDYRSAKSERTEHNRHKHRY